MNEIKTRLENLLEKAKGKGYVLEYDIEELLSIGNDLENEGVDIKYKAPSLYDIIDTHEDYFEDMVRKELNDGGTLRLGYFLQQVNLISCGRYVRLNAYGNLEEIDVNDFVVWCEDVLDVLN